MHARVCTVIALVLCLSVFPVTGWPGPGVPGVAPPARAQVSGAEAVACPGVSPADPVRDPPAQQLHRDLTRAHTIATGAGVTVAVIDTGVSPHPRLPDLIAGGDLVGVHRQEGLPGEFIDCDGHGTIIAGIIAARPDPGSGWPYDGSGDAHLGIAPEAQLIAIKQTSAYVRTRENSPVGTLNSLTESIHRAIDLGARVINISVVSCLPADQAAPDAIAPLLHALQRAEDSGVIIVAASGNLGQDCPPGSTVYPAHSETVLSVSARFDSHTIAEYSVPGPQQLLSAPGLVPVGLSPRGAGFASAMQTTGGEYPFEGTSFAAPVISGTAALLRQRHPEASAEEIRERILGSAEPARGAFSPFAALTHEPTLAVTEKRTVAVPAPTPPDEDTARRATGVIIALVTALMSVGGLLGWWRRNPGVRLPGLRSSGAGVSGAGVSAAVPARQPPPGTASLSGSGRATRRTHRPRAGSRRATSPRS